MVLHVVPADPAPVPAGGPPEPARPVRRPRLRLVPAPRREPPYDDELSGTPARSRPDQPVLPLEFLLPSGLPTALPRPAPLRVVADLDDEGPRRTGSAELPDARQWAARLAQAVLEVCTSGRPVAQLMRWTSEEVYLELAARSRVAGRGNVLARRARAEAQVRSMRVFSPADGVVESSAVVVRDGRVRALALRLEGLNGRWVCTALEMG